MVPINRATISNPSPTVSMCSPLLSCPPDNDLLLGIFLVSRDQWRLKKLATQARSANATRVRPSSSMRDIRMLLPPVISA